MTGFTANMAEWTSEEDEAIRRLFPTGGTEATAAVLPGRTRHAIFHRARKLHLVNRRTWTQDDDARLRNLWNSEMGLDDISQRLDRSEIATYWRAQHIGLPLGCPEGWEYLTEACRRTGFESDTMRRILNAAGATIRRPLTSPSKKKSMAKRGSKRIRLRYLVAKGEVDAAVAQWMEAEPVAVAARRVGIGRQKLADLLTLAGVRRKRPKGRPKAGVTRPYWRVSPDDVEKALALRGQRREAA